MSHHGHAPKERRLLPVQCPCLSCWPPTISEARRANNELARYASSRQTASAVARSCVQHKSRLIVGGRSWYVAPRQRAEREKPPAGAML